MPSNQKYSKIRSPSNTHRPVAVGEEGGHGKSCSYTAASCAEKQQKMTSISSASFAFFAAKNFTTSRTAIFAASSIG